MCSSLVDALPLPTSLAAESTGTSPVSDHKVPADFGSYSSAEDVVADLLEKVSRKLSSDVSHARSVTVPPYPSMDTAATIKFVDCRLHMPAVCTLYMYTKVGHGRILGIFCTNLERMYCTRRVGVYSQFYSTINF